MTKKLGYGCAVLGMMALMLVVALMGFEHVALDGDRYNRYQEALDVYASVGVPKAELEQQQLLMEGYLEGWVPAEVLNQTVPMFGQEQKMFNAREMQHIEDVQSLFALERTVKAYAFWIGAVLLLAALFIGQIEEKLHWTGFVALGAWALVFLVLAAVCGFDFDAAFIKFHEVLFTNDLWQLDPMIDAMIRMYPQQFFEWMARDIGIFMGLFALFAACAPLLLKVFSWIAERMVRHGGDDSRES